MAPLAFLHSACMYRREKGDGFLGAIGEFVGVIVAEGSTQSLTEPEVLRQNIVDFETDFGLRQSPTLLPPPLGPCGNRMQFLQHRILKIMRESLFANVMGFFAFAAVWYTVSNRVPLYVAESVNARILKCDAQIEAKSEMLRLEILDFKTGTCIRPLAALALPSVCVRRNEFARFCHGFLYSRPPMRFLD